MMKTLNIKRILARVGVIIVMTVVIIVFECGLRLRDEYRHAFLDAKNIELTLRLIAYDYYKEDRLIYDSIKPNGLSDNVEEELKLLSGAQGTVTLGFWDVARQAAGSFVYEKDNYVVFYDYDKNLNRANWNIYYRVNSMSYSNGLFQS